MIITRIIEKDLQTGRERVIREEPTMGLRMWRRVVRLPQGTRNYLQDYIQETLSAEEKEAREILRQHRQGNRNLRLFRQTLKRLYERAFLEPTGRGFRPAREYDYDIVAEEGKEKIRVYRYDRKSDTYTKILDIPYSEKTFRRLRRWIQTLNKQLRETAY